MKKITEKLTTTLTLPALPGTWDRSEASKVFTGWMDSCIESWNCAHNDATSLPTTIERFKLKKDGTFLDMFGKTPKWFTKAQILDIVKNHSELLNQDWYNFFPYQNNDGKRFVFSVYRSDGKWYLVLRELEGTRVWNADRGRILFLPSTDTPTLGTEDTSALEPSDALSLATRVAKLEQILKHHNLGK